jgi:membrane protease YdiL (CAAX protease family)
VAVVAGPPLFGFAADRLVGPFPAPRTQLIVQLVYCGLAVLLAWLMLRVEHRTWRSIGLRPPRWTTGALAVLMVGTTLFLLPLVTSRLLRITGAPDLEGEMRRLAAIPLGLRAFVGGTGGVIEELLYRGCAIEALAALTRRRWIGATIAVIAFALAHVPTWGLAFALAADLPFGILMTACYLWQRDLPANMLAHGATLVVQMLTTVP